MTPGDGAGIARRFAALLYDGLLLAAVMLIFTTALVLLFARSAIVPETVGAWGYLYRGALLFIIVGYYVANWMRSGQTLGMRAWRLRATGDHGGPVTLQAALLRCLFSVLAWAPAGLGVWWLYVDSRKLALHDRLSRTRVIRLSRS